MKYQEIDFCRTYSLPPTTIPISRYNYNTSETSFVKPFEGKRLKLLQNVPFAGKILAWNEHKSTGLGLSQTEGPVMKKTAAIIPAEHIAKCILQMREQKVILDKDLADLYGVATKVLIQAVKRNTERFPEDFMFQLTNAEFENLRSQTVTSRWGGRRYAPYAFTEQGVAMLSSVLRSKRAVQINIAIMRTFVRLREILAGNAALRRKIEKHDEQIKYIFNILSQMRTLPEPKKASKTFGFHGRKAHKKSDSAKGAK